MLNFTKSKGKLSKKIVGLFGLLLRLKLEELAARDKIDTFSISFQISSLSPLQSQVESSSSLNSELLYMSSAPPLGTGFPIFVTVWNLLPPSRWNDWAYMAGLGVYHTNVWIAGSSEWAFGGHDVP